MNATKGQYLAKKMAGHKPLTKLQMLRKWRSLGSIREIEQAINWIRANTTLSENPFLFVWLHREPTWGFKSTYGEVSPNLHWNLQYLLTRMVTTQQVLDHAVNSPVVVMTPSEKRAAKAVSAQVGGVVAYLQQVIHALP